MFPHELLYASGKFASAVHGMAVSQAPLRERLYRAWLEFHVIHEGDFPEGSSVRSDFVALDTRLSWADDQSGRGTLLATLAVISDQECRRLVQLVCDVHTGIEGELDALFGPLPGFLDDEWDVPLCETRGSG
jgi:hypothetical protein